MIVGAPHNFKLCSVRTHLFALLGIMASINRNFTGFGRELFTDTGKYTLWNAQLQS
jgi:hypothetical protein